MKLGPQIFVSGYHPDGLYRMGDHQICAKFNRMVCGLPGGHYRQSKKTGEQVEQHHLCSFVLHCSGLLCGQRFATSFNFSTVTSLILDTVLSPTPWVLLIAANVSS